MPSDSSRSRPSRPSQWFIGTIAVEHWSPPYWPPGIDYLVGQLECGESGYVHWQLVAHTSSKQRVSWFASHFGCGGRSHWEPTRSAAALDYVAKTHTSVSGFSISFGRPPFNRASATDWAAVLELAKRGDFQDPSIPSDVLIRHYPALKMIAKDFCVPVALERTVLVFWGPTGVGKSRRAWAEAGLDAYPKDPMSKYWDGYRGQENVVIDEFRGDISISHVLRWFDRYPVIVEAKHGALALKATKIWVTSNLSPLDWYRGKVGQETIDALMRRLEVHFISE